MPDLETVNELPSWRHGGSRTPHAAHVRAPPPVGHPASPGAPPDCLLLGSAGSQTRPCLQVCDCAQHSDEAQDQCGAALMQGLL